MSLTDRAATGRPALHHTGPLGRLARLVLAAALGLSLYSILDQGGRLTFRHPSILGEQAKATTGLACLVGLHLLDEWEARRRSRRHEGGVNAHRTP